jgi:hypothetical protein
VHILRVHLPLFGILWLSKLIQIFYGFKKIDETSSLIVEPILHNSRFLVSPKTYPRHMGKQNDAEHFGNVMPISTSVTFYEIPT